MEKPPTEIDLNNNDDNEVEKNEDSDNLPEVVMNLSNDIEIRTRALETYTSTNENALELINKIIGVYRFSKLSLLEKYIFHICMNSSINNYYKLLLVTDALCSNDEFEERYIALNEVCKNSTDIPTPIMIDAITLLLESKNFRKEAIDYFVAIINDNSLECDYRYKTILRLENKKTIPNCVEVIAHCLVIFLDSTFNTARYKILAGQYLLQNCRDLVDTGNVENIILNFARDTNVEYNIRADAADSVIRLGSDENKQLAHEIINELSGDVRNVRTIFDNAQNVHIKDIEASVMEVLEYLNSHNLTYIKEQEHTVTFESIRGEITKILNTNENNEYTKDDIEKVGISFNRIYMDRILYSKYCCTLINILVKVWLYIQNNQHKDEMIKRLIQELIDTSGTCSSGYLTRIINSITGFGDLSIRISWEDQIIANFIGRLNARFRDFDTLWSYGRKLDMVILTILEKRGMRSKIIEEIKKKRKVDFEDNEIDKDKLNAHVTNKEIIEEFTEYLHDQDIEKSTNDDSGYTIFETTVNDMMKQFKEEVAMDMATDSSKYSDRLCFLTFFRETMLDIREEMYEEFKDYMSDTDFDLYTQRAVLKYENGE